LDESRKEGTGVLAPLGRRFPDVAKRELFEIFFRDQFIVDGIGLQSSHKLLLSLQVESPLPSSGLSNL
jgi:hypothetical protein